MPARLHPSHQPDLDGRRLAAEATRVTSRLGQAVAAVERRVATVESRQIAAGPFAWDPGSIGAGGFVATTVTVQRARLGDRAVVAADADLGAGLLLDAQVVADDSVRITIGNLTSGPVDPPAHEYRVSILRGLA